MQVATLTLDPIMDTATALHCEGCGETVYDGHCFNVGDCIEADRKASPARGVVSSPRAWTMGGRVD